MESVTLDEMRKVIALSDLPDEHLQWILDRSELREYQDGDVIHIDLAQEVSFLNKAAIKSTLVSIPENSKVVINANDTVYIAHDVLDLIKEFKNNKAKSKRGTSFCLSCVWWSDR